MKNDEIQTWADLHTFAKGLVEDHTMTRDGVAAFLHAIALADDEDVPVDIRHLARGIDAVQRSKDDPANLLDLLT